VKGDLMNAYPTLRKRMDNVFALLGTLAVVGTTLASLGLLLTL
jgi:hypothetical protein